jgi:phage/plasmid-like protein (TIGR03299 family)
VAGNQYAPVQNEEHAEFLNALVDESGAHFETAGSLRDGKEVFISMKLPDTMKVGGVDPVDTYLLAVNTHDGTKSFRVITTKVRVVCANTLAAALRGAGDGIVSIRHTAGAGGAVARARQALDLTFKYDEKFQHEAEDMINRELTNAEFDKIVEGLFPLANDASDLVEKRVKEVRNDLHNLFTDSPTTTEIRNTAWAGYQAITEWTDWFKNIPGKEGAAEVTARAENLMAGKEDERKRQAFQAFAAAAHRVNAEALVA